MILNKYNILSLSLNIKKPEYKYFLIKICELYINGDKFKILTKSFSEELGISERTINESLKCLLAEGLLDREKIAEGKGRPRSIFWLSKKLFLQLEKCNSNIKETHNQLIKELFFSDRATKDAISNKVLLSKKKHPLKLSNRLLLSTLLLHANKEGVVKHLGVGDLSKLTCMSFDRVSSQIGKLLKLGYIRTKYSGVTGSNLFGLSKGGYFLNLEHENFNSIKNNKITVCFDLRGDESNRQTEALKLFRLARTIEKRIEKKDHLDSIVLELCKQVPCIDDINGLTSYQKGRFFSGYHGDSNFWEITGFFQGQINIVEHLQIKLYDYATDFLTNNLDILTGENKGECNKLALRIERELIPAKFLQERNEDVFPSERQKMLLTKCIYNVSKGLAHWILCLIKNSKEIELSDCAILIRPPITDGSFRHYFSVEIDTPNVSHLNNQVIKVSFPNLTQNESVSKESELSLEERYLYGLATRPQKVVSRWPEKRNIV